MITSLLLAGYLGTGLILGKFLLNFGDKQIRKGLEDNNPEAMSLAEQAKQFTNIMGHRNFMIMLYMLLVLFWLPAIIIAYLKSSKK